MDLVDILRKKINVLEDGAYAPGLKAVLSHIETAFRHLSRGQDTEDDTAFADAIYRTNQAFEGSIKEAYRVLAGQDPARKRPYDIEQYLEQNNIFRNRVLKQLKIYRTEWRNPSAHDYKLDFDESEAFLAIASVSAFACLLLDQIAERLAFEKAQAEARARNANVATTPAKIQSGDLLAIVTELLTEFCKVHVPTATSADRPSESQVIGTLHGFLSAAAPALQVETQAYLTQEKLFRADLLVTRGTERLVIELKRTSARQNYVGAVTQITHYLLIGKIQSGVVLFLPNGPSEMERLDSTITALDAPLVILAPPGAHLLGNRTIPGLKPVTSGP